MKPISIIAAATHQHDASDDRAPSKEPRFARQAVVAANKLNLDQFPIRVDEVIIGSQFGGIDEYDFNVCQPALSRLDQLAVPHAMPNLAAFLVARRFPLVREVGCPSLACASGMEAIIQACEKQADGIIIAGGTDWPSPYMANSFELLGVASRSKVCRPLRKDRDGTVASGGAALVALTRASLVTPLGRIVGVGRAFDCESRTKNSPRAIISAMADAIDDLPSTMMVDLVVAHATGTVQGDAIEAEAIERFCVDLGMPDVRVISYRGKAGHWFGAAGPQSLIELIVDRRFNTGEHVFDDQQIEVFRKPRLVQHATQRDRLCIVNALGMGGIATSIAVQF